MKIALFELDNWREIAQSLGRNKMRTFLTAFGIFWGTAMLALLWGGADGLKGILSRQFEGLSTNLGALWCNNRSMSYMGFNRGSTWSMSLSDVEVIRRVAPALDKMSTLNAVNVTASVGMYSKNASAMGVMPEYDDICTPVITEGRFLNESDEAASRKVCILGTDVASELFPFQSPIGQGVSLDGIRFTVIGVAKQRSSATIGGSINTSVLMPASTLARTFNLGPNVDFLVFTAKDGHKPSEIKDAIRRVLSRIHSIHPDDDDAYGFMDISAMFEMINGLFLGVKILALFVGLASLMAGVIGEGNIMWIVVKERTHEFGVRRAIGAKPADITMQVLSESILLTVVAGTAGICFAAGVLGLADMVTAQPLMPPAGFQISFGRAVGIVVAFIVLGSIAGTLPAIKAMKIKPIEALRTKD